VKVVLLAGLHKADIGRCVPAHEKPPADAAPLKPLNSAHAHTPLTMASAADVVEILSDSDDEVEEVAEGVFRQTNPAVYSEAAARGISI